MDSLAALLKQVESHDFSGRANLASSFGGFLNAISSDVAVRELAKRVADNGDEALRVLRHVIHLAQVAVDRRYEHPHDSAMAAYLWVLSSARPEFASIAAQAAVEAQHTWWSGKLAGEILGGGMLSTSSTTTRQYVAVEAAIPEREIVNTTASVFVIALHGLWNLNPWRASFQYGGSRAELISVRAVQTTGLSNRYRSSLPEPFPGDYVASSSQPGLRQAHA